MISPKSSLIPLSTVVITIIGIWSIFRFLLPKLSKKIKLLVQVSIWIIMMILIFFGLHNSATTYWDTPGGIDGKPFGGVEITTPWISMIILMIITSVAYLIFVYKYNKKHIEPA